MHLTPVVLIQLTNHQERLFILLQPELAYWGPANHEPYLHKAVERSDNKPERTVSLKAAARALHKAFLSGSYQQMLWMGILLVQALAATATNRKYFIILTRKVNYTYSCNSTFHVVYAFVNILFYIPPSI